LSHGTISELGSYRHLFFIGDESSLLKELKGHVAIGKYVYPMSALIHTLNELINTR